MKPVGQQIKDKGVLWLSTMLLEKPEGDIGSRLERVGYGNLERLKKAIRESEMAFWTKTGIEVWIEFPEKLKNNRLHLKIDQTPRGSKITLLESSHDIQFRNYEPPSRW